MTAMHKTVRPETRLYDETVEVADDRVIRIADRAIPFDRFIEMADGHDVELDNGVIVERPMIQLDHERCSMWLCSVLSTYVQQRALGEVLSSRFMVRLHEFGARMPDILFVRRERREIIQQKAIYGAPDLVIEIVSPDRPSHLRTLEAEYSRLGVAEIVFVELKRLRIRMLRRGDGTYTEDLVEAGPVRFQEIDGLVLDAASILREPHPDVYDTLTQLFASLKDKTDEPK